MNKATEFIAHYRRALACKGACMRRSEIGCHLSFLLVSLVFFCWSISRLGTFPRFGAVGDRITSSCRISVYRGLFFSVFTACNSLLHLLFGSPALAFLSTADWEKEIAEVSSEIFFRSITGSATFDIKQTLHARCTWEVNFVDKPFLFWFQQICGLHWLRVKFKPNKVDTV